MNESQEVVSGPLVAYVRECWVDSFNLHVSCEFKRHEKDIRTIVIESVMVEEEHRQQGHFKRFLEGILADDCFEMVIVEGVQNPILASALLRWGWNVDTEVMDFYKRKK